jgi:hypothetical protein
LNHLIIVLLVLVTFSCSSTKNSKGNFFEENREINLYAFIGKKISIREFNPNKKNEIKETDNETGDTIVKRSITMDYAFIAEYEVVHNVFNNLDLDTVRFSAFDHYGRPGFEKYQYVLLYISKYDDGTFYHQKYQFDPLVKKNDSYYGENGLSIKQLFKAKKNSVFKARSTFK